MKVLMCGSPNVGIGAWRQTIPGNALRLLGHRVTNLQSSDENFVENPELLIRSVAAVLERGDAEALWSGRYDPTTYALARKCDEWGLPFIFDIDDFAHGIPDYNPAAAAARNALSFITRNFDRIIPHASAVSCATPFLRDFYNHFHGAFAPAFTCPNLLDPGVWMRDPTPRPGVLRVGLIYNANRHGDMRPLLPLLRDLMLARKIRILQMGEFPMDPFWCTSPSHITWTRRTDIRQFWRNLQAVRPDVILSRLIPNDFNAAKSNIKALEAAAVSAVLIGSDFGELARSVPREAAILIPPTCDEAEFKAWRDAIESLAADKLSGGVELKRISKAWRGEVAAHWMADPSGATMWEQPLKAEVTRGRHDTSREWVDNRAAG